MDVYSHMGFLYRGYPWTEILPTNGYFQSGLYVRLPFSSRDGGSLLTLTDNIEKYHSNITAPQHPHVYSHCHLHRRVWSLGRQLPSPSSSLPIIVPGSHPCLLRRPLPLPQQRRRIRRDRASERSRQRMVSINVAVACPDDQPGDGVCIRHRVRQQLRTNRRSNWASDIPE